MVRGARAILGRLLDELVPIAPADFVVDVGCGAGANLASLAGRGQAVGIDTSAEVIAMARQRYPAPRWIVGEAPRDLPGEVLQGARLVMLNDVLEHVPDDAGLLRDVALALRPGASLLLTVPAGPELWSPHDVSFGHYRRYRQSDFERLWATLPVTCRLVSYFNTRLYPVIRGVRGWNAWRGETAGRAGTDFAMRSRPVNALLSRIMCGEVHRLLRVARGESGRAFRRGVSLVAILERREDCPAMSRATDCSVGESALCETAPLETAFC